MRSVAVWFKYLIGMIFFKMQGWTCQTVPKEIGSRYLLIGFPHNTNMDAFFGIAFSFVNRVQTSPMIKKEWMFWPMSIGFKALHVLPVDRNAASDMVDQVVGAFAEREKFIPVIFPEGTRKDVNRIKTGFWHIASKANVPLVLLYKNDQKKQLMIIGHLFTGTSKNDDLIKIRDIYRNAGYEIPLEP